MGVSRRELLRQGMYATMGMFFSGAVGGAGAMLWPAKVSGFGGTVTVPKKLSEIKVGEVLKVREGKFYLVRTEDGIMALYWKCVHLGCTVPYNEGQQLFMCPCHQSTYLPTGQNVAGPATRPLDYMELEVADDLIHVNTAKIHQRVRHDPSQAVKV